MKVNNVKILNDGRLMIVDRKNEKWNCKVEGESDRRYKTEREKERKR
jgi:hypothetical protein